MTKQSRIIQDQPLSNATLSALPKDIVVPVYDRAALTPGIVHIGVGNFHRAHQAWYLHQLMQQGMAHDWAIVGAGVRAYDETQRQKLAAQDYLTTLIELSPTGQGTEVVGSMIDYTAIEAGNLPLIAQMAKPEIRIVALTVTEGGYYIDPATKGFDAGHEDILFDAKNPRTPGTAFGAMIEALRQRRDAGTGPFTALSCDNLQGNGDILRQTVVSLAKLSDPELAAWIDENASFPTSMVDCIVPATGPTELALARSLGVDDAAPVTHESFRQWVIEDDFCAGRPDWDKAGATFTDDVHGYEAMKIRILNGGHQVIAGAGDMLSLETIADCMGNEDVAGLFGKIARTEIAPLVNPVPEMTSAGYVDLVARRFANPKIVDTTRRVAFDGSSRHPGFIVPTIKDGLKNGTPVEGLALVSAIWARMCAGTREDGSEIEANDPHWDDLQTVAKAAKNEPSLWLAQKQYYGDLGDDPRFADAFAKWLPMIWEKGTKAAIQRFLNP